MEKIDFQGKTDPVILNESLHAMGFDNELIETKTESLKERYFHHLKNNIGRFPSVLLPGVRGLLDSLSDRKDILTGLLTGNFKESAMIKLGNYGLENYFGFGAFGDDAPVRNGLPPVAKKRINEKYSINIDFSSIYIIGDTVYDIECARAHGAVAVAVGTGWGDKSLLFDKNPEFYFDDLSDTDSVIKAITE
jgi:phosphoglycolate phosphatase-like HAD superfamily hydrolase